MKKILTNIILLNFLFYATGILALPKQKLVLITQIVEHPALNSTVDGIIDQIKKENKKQNAYNIQIHVESAQGNPALALSIANQFINKKPDVIIAVGTISAQSFLKYLKNEDIKVLFSSVTDPIDSNIVSDLNQRSSNISGVSNFVPLEPQLSLFKQIQPNIKRLGILYNTGESNSVSIVKKLEKICNKFDITLVKQVANKTVEISSATKKLVENVDAIFISNDNTALSALASIIKIANQAKIPVYVSDTDATELGALAALGPNQYSVGTQTGKMAFSVLTGSDIRNMPVEFPDKTNLYINLNTAKDLGISIPDDIIKRANVVIHNKNKQ